jgi:hypothetical protein
MRKISELQNLGSKSEERLNAVGIFRADLRRIGSVEVYRLLRERALPASRNLV